MNQNEAELIMNSALIISLESEKIASISRNIKNRPSDIITESAINIIGLVTRNIIFPISKTHPDLDPDK